MGLVNIGIDFIWREIPSIVNIPYWTLIVCTLGGILVGICEKYFGNYPKLMPEVINEFKMYKRVEYKSIPKAFLTSLIILFSGASLGPEAALVSIIGGLSTFVGDVLKYLVKGKRLEKYESIITEFSMEAALGVIFHAPLVGLTPIIEDADSKKIKKLKFIVYSMTTASGFGVMMLLSKFDNRESFIVHFGNYNLGTKEILFIIPLIIFGILIAILYDFYGKILYEIFKPLKDYKIIKALIGGIILGIIGTYLPYTLFSGEHEIKELVKEWSNIPLYILILSGILKLFLTEVCLSTGWRGGHIFPIIFSGTILGYAFSAIFSLDPVVTVTIVTTAFTSAALRNSLVAILLLILFFPTKLIWIMLIAAFLSAYILKKFDYRNKDKKINE